MKLTTKVLIAGIALSVLGAGFNSGPVLAVGLTLFVGAVVAKMVTGGRL